MKIIIFGGTGSIGRALIKDLIKNDFEPFVVSRNPQKASALFPKKVKVLYWDTKDENAFENVFTGLYAIINLAAENIGAKLWSKKQKAKILESRVSITRKISKIVNESEVKPTVFIQASAIGYYGSDMNMEFDESSALGEGFLANVCAQWENALELEDKEKIRVVFIRTGIVLDTHDGLISKMKLSFKFFFGGHFGNGKQWMPWIHIQDEVRAIIFLLKNDKAHGIYNLTAPRPERMRKFCKIFGAIQFRLSWFHVPAFVIKLLPGDMGEEIILSSQKVKPTRLQDAGFEFRFIKLEDALRDLLIEKKDG